MFDGDKSDGIPGIKGAGLKTLLKVLNSTHIDWADIPHQIQRWNKVNGEVNEGLVKRRKSEALLFEGKDWTEV